MDNKKLIRERMRDKPIISINEDIEIFNDSGDFVCPICDQSVGIDFWDFDNLCCLKCLKKKKQKYVL